MACGTVRFAYLSLPRSSSSSSTGFNPFITRTARFCTAQSRPFIRMSSPEIIEHVVLFKVKPDTDPTKVNAMLNNLASLASLDPVQHITAGPVVRSRSSSLSFTHLLHSRFASKSDLDTYGVHPTHLGVVKEHVLPNVDDVMAVDWVSNDGTAPVSVPPGSAIRLTFLKLKEGLGESEKIEVLGVIGGIKEKFPAIEQLSFGENFCSRSKGFSIASVAVFKDLNELEGLDSETEAANEEKEKEKVRDKLDGVVVLDYVVPSTQSASL